jgi:hypothetical protein
MPTIMSREERKLCRNPRTCACADRGCPAHLGVSSCATHADTVLYRIDMDDVTGTVMCADCASDALDSGLFSFERRKHI